MREAGELRLSPLPGTPTPTARSHLLSVPAPPCPLPLPSRTPIRGHKAEALSGLKGNKSGGLLLEEGAPTSGGHGVGVPGQPGWQRSSRVVLLPTCPGHASAPVSPGRPSTLSVPVGERWASGDTRGLWDILNPSFARTEVYGTPRVLGELARDSQGRTPRTAVCRREGPNGDKGHCGTSQRTAVLGESLLCPCSPTSQSGKARSGRGSTRRHEDEMGRASLLLKEKGEASLRPPGPGLSPPGASVPTCVLRRGPCAAGKTDQDHVFEASRGMLST